MAKNLRKSSGERTVTNAESVSTPSPTPDISFLVQQIHTCLNLAKESSDVETAAALRKLAGVFADRAIALGADPKTIPRGS